MKADSHSTTEAVCSRTACCCPSQPSRLEADIGTQATLWRIPTIDCAVEESEIRRVLEPLNGIHSLTFRLASRSLAISAQADALEAALQAIRRAGFKPEPIAMPKSSSFDDASDPNETRRAGFERELPSGWRDARRFGAALVLALVAELIAFRFPDP